MKTTVLAVRAVLLVSLAATAMTASPAMAQYRGYTNARLTAVSAWGSRTKKDSSTSKPQLRSESTAKSLSLWFTVIPTTAGIVAGNHNYHAVGGALVVGGMIVGPSTGYFYGHCPDRGARGLLIRVVTLGVTVGLTALMAENTHSGDFGTDLAHAELAIAVGGLGVGVLTYEAIHDISHVKSEVRKQNDKTDALSLSLAPKYFAQDKAFGLELRVAL